MIHSVTATAALDPAGHLQEVEVAVPVHEEFHRARAHIAGLPGDGHGGLAHGLADLGRDEGRGSLVGHLLEAALHRAFPLPEIHVVAVLIAHDLDLDVPRMHQGLLHVDALIPEREDRVALHPRQRPAQLRRGLGQADALPVPAQDRFDHHGVADSLGGLDEVLVLHRLVDGGQHRSADLEGDGPGLGLVRQRLQDLGAGADPGEPGLDDLPGGLGVFRDEPVAGVDGVGTGLPADVDELVHPEVALPGRRRADGVGADGQAHVHGAAIRIGIDRHGRNVQLPAGPDDAAGDFASVGHKQLGHRHMGFLELRHHRTVRFISLPKPTLTSMICLTLALGGAGCGRKGDPTPRPRAEPGPCAAQWLDLRTLEVRLPIAGRQGRRTRRRGESARLFPSRRPSPAHLQGGAHPGGGDPGEAPSRPPAPGQDSPAGSPGSPPARRLDRGRLRSGWAMWSAAPARSFPGWILGSESRSANLA